MSVVLSGGDGSRLWPLSRRSFPKQLWPLVSKRSLIQDAALRGVKLSDSGLIVVCNQEHRFLITEQLLEVGVDNARILLEPEGRNSAPAITVAALMAHEIDPAAIIFVMPADASIKYPERLFEAVAQSVPSAQSGNIILFGVSPDRPETGYGYIKVLSKSGIIPGPVESFIEKPNLAKAKKMLADGNYLWNAGMFLGRADTFLQEIARFEPYLFEAVTESYTNKSRDMTFYRLEKNSFCRSPNISFDYAVIERTSLVQVIEIDMGWSDIGSWGALWRNDGGDAHGNVCQGDVIVEQTKDCFVRSDGPLTVVSHVNDLVVVVSGDAVLVTDRHKTQKVKDVVSSLRQKHRKEADVHSIIYRPWGHYQTLNIGDRFHVKQIIVLPGEQLSLQKHLHRAEHWVVVQGTAQVRRGEDHFLLQENESVYVACGILHRLGNPGRIPLILIEIQTGSYLGEDDIIRLEDEYNRN